MPAHKRIKPIRRTAVSPRVARLINERYDGNVSGAARGIGISREKLRGIALGVTACPTYADVEKIAAHFKVTHAWLAGTYDPD